MWAMLGPHPGLVKYGELAGVDPTPADGACVRVLTKQATRLTCLDDLLDFRVAPHGVLGIPPLPERPRVVPRLLRKIRADQLAVLLDGLGHLGTRGEVPGLGLLPGYYTVEAVVVDSMAALLGTSSHDATDDASASTVFRLFKDTTCHQSLFTVNFNL